MVPKLLRDLLRRELCGHETYLDKRTNAVLQQAVVDLIDVGKIVDGIARGIFVVQAYFVVENRMEADVVETGGLLHHAEIVAVAFAQRQDGAAGAKHALPIMGKGMAGRIDIDGEGFTLYCWRRLRGRRLRGRRLGPRRRRLK